MSPEGWAVFAVFAATIVGFLVRPLPMGPVVLIALTVTAATGTLSPTQVLSGYGSRVVWLVVAAFLIAGTVGRTGLGRRIALLLVRRLGGSTLGLGYAFCGAELVLAPVVPSNTARGGGIVAPIVRSVAQALGSEPGSRPRRAGEYLVLTAAQANLVTAAMFLTAMALNPYVAEQARMILDQDFGWLDWALGAIVPGLLSLALLPWAIHRLAPPGLRTTRRAQVQARRALREMGPWSRAEKWMAAVFLLLVALLAYFTSLCGCTTHYSTAPVVIYFGFGYVSVPRWLRVGLLLSFLHLLVWLTVGLG